ncbi:hypothetical protein GCM10023260_07900 [Bartonella acomydis]|uniref:Uncharacterized protein n=1 Tax=Bartonella acomydis TaxID=686234 RepID=A0ABP9MJN5_9HYPH
MIHSHKMRTYKTDAIRAPPLESKSHPISLIHLFFHQMKFLINSHIKTLLTADHFFHQQNNDTLREFERKNELPL